MRVVVPSLLALASCDDGASTEPEGERRAELLAVSAPPTTAPLGAFTVLAVFGRGACDRPRAVVERSPGALRLGMRVVAEQPPGPGVCVSSLVPDTVRVAVLPPFELPFTVRLERAGGADSVVVVRAP